MNYFRVHAVGLVGLQGIPLEVECMQSRRLPYLQILGSSAGAASEMRERVMSALESAGCKLPTRRITVRFQPGIHGFSLENLDLAVALGILAASGKIPANRLEDVMICGSLGLDGRIQAVGSEFAAQHLFAKKKFRGAILPWEESAWLSNETLAFGGGFDSLAQVISFLTEQRVGQKRRLTSAESIFSPKRWQACESSARLLELAASGGHHALLLCPSSTPVSEFAAALSEILPALDESARAEQDFLRRLRGNRSSDFDSYVEIPFSTPAGTPNRQYQPAEELLFAKNGVIFADKLASRDFKAIAPLFRWMENGKTEWSKLGHTFSERMQASVVASSAPCECGGRLFGKCSCRPLELQKYRRRLDRAVAGPFDIRFCLPEQGAKKEVSLAGMKERVEGARALAGARQRGLNATFSAEEALTVKTWSKKASLLLRSLSAEAGLAIMPRPGLMRLALTVSDLRGAEEVSEEDLLEARHYSGFD